MVQRDDMSFLSRTSLPFNRDDHIENAQSMIDQRRGTQPFVQTMSIEPILVKNKKKIPNKVLERLAYFLSQARSTGLSLIQMVNITTTDAVKEESI